MSSLIRALIVDDEADLRELLRLYLEASGRCEVVGEATDGHHAIRLARALQPDVVILDIKMPGLSGLDALADIRRAAADARILVYSSGGPAEHDEALQRGAHAYRRKGGPLRQVVQDVTSLAERLSK
jgi:DNA-binding NarL/FixJ family response regulator